MDNDGPPFHWLRFAQGRARFSGGIRGIDEVGHETIAADVGSGEHFGEIRREFRANGNDYDIAVVSFGYGDRASVGMPMPGTCEVFTLAEVATLQALIAQLIAAGAGFEDRPALLVEYPDAHFMGEVLFDDGWILASAERMAS